MNKNDLHLLVQSKCHRVPLRATHEEITNPTGILAYEYSKIMKEVRMEQYEDRYQYLNSLSIEEYDKETSEKEQEEFCEYQAKYHPDEVIYYQTHNPD